jgi:hypothetical protein
MPRSHSRNVGYVWFVHRVLGLSGYGFSVDDDTSDVSAAASNYTPVSQRVLPNNLQYVFAGPLTNKVLQNTQEWFPSVNWGPITDDGTITNPTSGPNAGETIVTLTTQTKYWQISNPNPAGGVVGAFVSGPGVPPGTVVKAQGDVNALILILSNHVDDSKGAVSLTFSGIPPANPIQDSGFETPLQTATPPANYTYNPSSEQWTFDANSGIAGNGSSLTALNGPAPEGTQVGILHNQGAISQLVDFQAGTYALSFEAAQRQNGQSADKQTIDILVDDNKIGEITPSGTNYTAYTVPFTVTAGKHVIKFVGTAPSTGDTTAFIDAVNLTVTLPKNLAQAGPSSVTTLQTDHSLRRSTGAGAPQTLSPAGTILAASGETNSSGSDVAFAITADHTLWEFDPSQAGVGSFDQNGWGLISPGNFLSITATEADGEQPGVFGVLAGDSLWEFTTQWQQLASSGVLAVTAG